MKKTLVIGAALAALFLAAAPALAAEPRYYPRESPAASPPGPDAGQFRIKLGMFNPDGESNYWTDENFAYFTGDISDFDDLYGGLDFLWSASKNISIVLSLEFYEGEVLQAYQPLPEPYPDLSDLSHTSRLEMTPLTLGVLFFPAGRHAGLVPYLGAGGGLYWWEYSESGDFCYFDVPGDPSCVEALGQTYVAEGVEAGWFAVAGLDIPVTPAWSVFGEAKWMSATADLGDDFEGLGELDLSGVAYMAGFSWRF